MITVNVNYYIHIYICICYCILFIYRYKILCIKRSHVEHVIVVLGQPSADCIYRALHVGTLNLREYENDSNLGNHSTMVTWQI